MFGHIDTRWTSPKYAAIVLAFCALGKEMTGLPIDFQIQPQSYANKAYPNPRGAMLEVRQPGA